MATSLELKNHVPLSEEEEGFRYAMQLVSSSGLPRSVKCAYELGVFDILGKAGPGAKLSASEIAAQLPITNRHEEQTMLDSVLRVLASHSVLSCAVVDDEDASSGFKRLYGLLPVSKYFVTSQDGVSLGPMLLLGEDSVFFASWSKMKDAILEGGVPFVRAHGTDLFGYQGIDFRFSKLFNNGMFNLSSVFMKKLVEVYKGFDTNIKQLVDVGGGLGLTIHKITEAYPHIKGINFDLPHVVQHAPSYPGVEHIGGDMFVSVPSGDAIIIKWVLHNWSDEKCLEILKNCYKAIPENGKVIVVEAVVPVMPGTSTAEKAKCLVNVELMTQLPGKERSKEEFLALATRSGFAGVRFPCYVNYYCIMEFFK